MTKEIRLFETTSDGKLYEVDGDMRGTRRVSSVSLIIDVLWTPEEEAARDAEEALAAAAKEAAAQAAAQEPDSSEKLRRFLQSNPDVADLIR